MKKGRREKWWRSKEDWFATICTHDGDCDGGHTPHIVANVPIGNDFFFLLRKLVGEVAAFKRKKG